MSRGRAALLLLVLALGLGLVALTPSPSWACSCAQATTHQQVEAAGTVAAGTVDWTATDGQSRTYQVSFDAVYKGSAASTEKLHTNGSDAACGVGDLAPGKRYLFFIEGTHPGELRIGLCGGTTAYDASLAQDIASDTGPPGKPLPAPVTRGTPDHQDHTGLVVALGALVLLLCLATGVTVARR